MPRTRPDAMGSAGAAGRRGTNHAGAPAATAASAWPAARALAPVAAFLLALAAAAPAARAQEFTQRGVPAEATAENGVVARDRALAAGRRAAWGRLAGELGAPRNLSDAQIEAMVDSIVIEEERTSPTRYSGRITVNFNPGRAGRRGGDVAAGGGGGGVNSGGGGGLSATSPGFDGPVVTHGGRPAPAAASIEAVAVYATLPEWLDLRRRLAASPGVASVDVLGFATDHARLRLGLRAPPGAVAEQLRPGGVLLSPPGGDPYRQAGGGWRLGLAGRY